ncbi:MAG: MmcQ/YjbR family DNA-binding protein [Lachnospiraceae bacterium]|nr:MmcQ/YjbR family DNA-binding protein [Lachnospiraceae bacterium]
MKESVFDYIKKKYKTSPEYLWKRYPEYAVFRHADNNKWFALQAAVPGDKLGIDRDEPVQIINVKVDDIFFRDMLIKQEGIIPAYHMNKQHWITVLLDGSVKQEQVFDLIDASYMATASAKKKQKIRPPKEWIIPSNPKYYDIQHAFDETDEIDWKQGAGIKEGDTIFMYVGTPVSAILYKCKVTKTDIPYRYQDDNLTIKALMKIKFLKRYEPDKFTFGTLKDKYGIFAVRGPRGITNSLSSDLNKN